MNIKDKLEKIRKVRTNRYFVDRLLMASQMIDRSNRLGSSNYIITSPKITNLLDDILKTGTQSI